VSGLLVVYAPDKSSVVDIIGKLPASLNDTYQILVLKPGIQVEAIEDLVARLIADAEVLLTKYKKRVHSYVG